MIEIKKIKEIINYIAYHNLSEKYKVFPFQNENTADYSVVNELLSEHTSYDLLIESLRKQYKTINNHICLKPENTPALLKMSGYIIDAEKRSNSFFYGRANELLKMKVAINKKIKNNIMLVGHPGTGKTRLVEEFAIRNELHNIFVVECAKLIGSTEYRGAFEQRTTDLLKYAKSCGFIVFFDEIHTLINLGKSTGGMSITDILKPYLLDEDLIFIGATTYREYLYFSEDEAFKRRFSIIRINEPSTDELVKIKYTLEENIFKDHLLNDIESEMVIKQLAETLPTAYFPDKLIDFLDYLYAYKKITQQNPDINILLNDFIEDYGPFNI